MRRIFILLVLLTLFLNIKATSQENWETVFDEQFVNNSNNWHLATTEERKSEIVGGKLIDSYTNRGYQITNTISVNFNEKIDYRITFSIANLKNGGYGFVWGFKDWNNYNAIIFDKRTNDYYYKIVSFSGGNEITHKDWELNYSSYGFKEENLFNSVSIIKKGNNLDFHWNNYRFSFASCPAEIWDNKECGIVISSGSKVAFDYLTIEEQRESKKLSQEQKQTETISPSSGSGIILTKNGYIATNHHVIEDAKHIEVDVYKGGVKKTYLADVIRNDVTNDLSLIKIINNNFVSADLKYGIKTHDVKVGEKVFSLGYPMIDLQGDEIKLTDGLISSKSGFQNDPTTYQISAPIQPGNSGGPLFDINGNLIGITSSRLNSATGAQNVNYAIKISYLLNFLDIESNIISLPSQSLLIGKPLTEMVAKLSPVVVLIRVNDKTITKDESELYIQEKPNIKTEYKTITEAKTSDVNIPNRFDHNKGEVGYISNQFKMFRYNNKTNSYNLLDDQQIISYIYITKIRIYLKKGRNESLLFEFHKWMMKENGDYISNDEENHIVLDKKIKKLTFYSSNYEYKYEYTISNQDNQLVLDNVND